MPDETDWVRSVLRATALGVIILCWLGMAVGMLPGVKIYEDTNDCFGRALGSLFSAHGGRGSTCEPHYVYVRTDKACGFEAVLVFSAVALGALAVRRWPRLLVAWLWPVVSFAAVAITFVLTFELDLFSTEHEVALWPAYVVGALAVLVALILAALVAVVPIVAGLRWRARRRAARDALPEARVV
jgi:hypothetical protein